MPGRQVFETALDQLSSKSLFVTAEGSVKFCDTTLADELGYERDALLDSNLFDVLVPQEKQATASQSFEQVITQDRDLEGCETPIRSAEGECRSIAWIDVVEDGDQTIVIGRLTTPQTIPLFDHELEPYRTLVDHFPNGLITLFDEDLRFRIVGGPAFEEVDLSPEDLRDNRLQDVFPEENVDGLRPLFRRALEGETNVTTLPLKDRFFEVQVLPVTDNSGNVVAGMSVSQDVTERITRERELEEARDRYKSLIQNASVPIFVGDETGTVHEMNESAEELTGMSRKELIGDSMLKIHPSEEEDRYRAGIRQHANEGGTRRYFPNGDQVYIVDDDGTRIPVEITPAVIEQGEETLVHALFRDISDYVWYENTLEELHENAGELVQATTDVEIAQTIVDTAIDTLDLQLISVNLMDTDAETLSPVAYSDDVVDVIGDPPSLPLTESLAGEVFLSKEAIRVDDVRSREEVYNSDTPIRSQLIVPIGEFGVIICGSTTAATFDQEDQRLLELLARNASSVFTRVNREQELRRREQDLKKRTETLERVEELNTRIRNLTQIAIQSETRDELEQEVCELLSDTDPFVFGWVGEISPERDELIPRTWAGRDQGYLDSCPLTLDNMAADPAVQTAQTSNPTIISNTATDVQEEPWRREAINRNFSSVIAVPIVFQDVLYGVLTLYAEDRDAITERIRDVLTDWGEIMGYAVKEVERTSAILSQQGAAVRFSVESEACPLLRIARNSQCTLLFEGLREQEGDESTVFVRVYDCSAQQFIEAAEQATVISSITQVSESDDGLLFQVTITEMFIASVLARYGIRLESIMGASEDSVRVRLVTPPTIPVHRVVDIVSTEYPDSTLLGTDDLTEYPQRQAEVSEQPLQNLTDRQREALELAYHGGYFESPKGLSGQELAEQMDISSSSFNVHLRTAERKILDAILGSSHPSRAVRDSR
jgi:PAS domain S-box-containing protein